jgi:hypothetical protein
MLGTLLRAANKATVNSVGVRCWSAAALVVAIAAGCTKGSQTETTTSVSTAPSPAVTAIASPAPDTSAAESAVPQAAPAASAGPEATPTPASAAGGAQSPATAEATATAGGAGSSTGPLTRPEGPPRRFTSAALIAAYAVLPDAKPTEGDAVQYALSSAQTMLDCDAVKRDFADDFAAHRNADRYMQALRRQARRLGLVSIDLRTYLGRYDFPAKSFEIGSEYGDGNSTFAFTTNDPCYVYQSVMPDGSRAYGGVEVELDNGPVLHRYPLEASLAEALQKRQGEYRFTERIVFYATTIARHSNERLGAVGHATKLVLEQRASNAPDSSPPTILMSTDL